MAQPHLGAKRGLRAVMRNLFAWLLVFIVVFPLLWMVSSSLKRKDELFGTHPRQPTYM